MEELYVNNNSYVQSLLYDWCFEWDKRQKLYFLKESYVTCTAELLLSQIGCD